MEFIVDTSVLIEIENNNQKIITEISQLGRESNSELYLTFFNFCEFYYGIISRSAKNKALAQERLNQYKLLNTSKNTAFIFCDLLSQLKKKGKIIPQFDLLIASIALEHNFTLLTMDEHFLHVPDLKIKMLKME
ncbi:MAG: type II toxin-antitoxin system VapC family toxin [Candidatus Woesearchaeota archaeon]